MKIIHQHFLSALFMALVGFALIGCAGPLHRPETTQDKLGYAQATLTGAYKTIASLAQRKRITHAEGVKLLIDADQVETALNASKAALSAGAFEDANKALSLAQKALMALEKTLQEKQK